MTIVTVFRRIPKPVIGMIGTVYDRAYQQFEATLDWLETTGVLVERFDPFASPDEVLTRPSVQHLFSAEGDRCMPLILVNDSVVSRGRCLSRAELARAVGDENREKRSAA